MELEPEKQIQLAELLRKKQNVDRFRKARGYEALSLELGVSVPTLRDTLRRGRKCGKLTPEQLEYAQLMRYEYDKHRPDFEDWKPDGIARRVGVSSDTVYRWENRIKGIG